MPIRRISAVPFQEVASADINSIQDSLYIQRGTGPNNTATAAVENQIAIQRKILVEMAQTDQTPPMLGGMVDTSFDWRDRVISYDLKIHRVRDIRLTGAFRGVAPDWHYQGSLYVGMIGGLYPIHALSPNSSVWLGMYVSPVDGALGFKKTVFYLTGTVSASVNMKV